MTAPFDIEIRRKERDTKGRYVARVGGVEAEMTISKLGASSIIIGHSGVPGALRGRGIGQAWWNGRRSMPARRALRSCRSAPSPRRRSPATPVWQDVLKR